MDKIVHFEIPAENMDRANKFYIETFGWEINKTPFMDDYRIVMTVPVDKKMMPTSPGAINGGMYRKQSPKDSTRVVIKVQSIEAYTKKIEKAGGKMLMKPAKVGDMGMYAMFTDTEGNTVGLWEDLKKT
ncbi:VOC family protein [Candidatus Woesearchaeota archaeon]|nr:VOC family protein [Candidatus Woesearchaeota archaeon]